MALAFTKTVALPPIEKSGGVVVAIYDITFDASGPAWTLSASDLNLNGLLFVTPAGVKDGYPLEVDHTNAPTSVAINAFQEADGATAMGAADAADLSAAIHRFLIVGY